MSQKLQQEAAIRFVDVCVSFAGRSKANVVLDQANFSVPQGKPRSLPEDLGRGKVSF